LGGNSFIERTRKEENDCWSKKSISFKHGNHRKRTQKKGYLGKKNRKVSFEGGSSLTLDAPRACPIKRGGMKGGKKVGKKRERGGKALPAISPWLGESLADANEPKGFGGANSQFKKGKVAGGKKKESERSGFR